MIEMDSAQLGELFPQSSEMPGFAFKGVETDSRKDCAGKLFVALRGERFDGHDYVALAAQKGAVAALVEHACDAGLPQLKVDDCRLAMGHLARWWRQQLSPRVVAITGSNGKTTVKEMLGRILRSHAPALVTSGNLNNDLGVPMTLMRLNSEQRFAVIEMGANHQGEISYLVSVAQPDIVYVNNAGAAHVEGFGSLRGVVKGKGEMYRDCRREALAVFNDDEQATSYWRQHAASEHSMSFSAQHDCDVRVNFEPVADGLQLNFKYADTEARCTILQHGAHNARNAGAAVTLALACGLELHQAVAALDGFGGVSGRQQAVNGVNQSCLIDDSYNANPDSLRAAVDVLCALPGTPWLALGDMAELGGDALLMHHSAIGQALDAGVQRVFAVGSLACRAAQAYPGQALCFDDHQQLAEHLLPRLKKGVNLLIKGSRSARMEQLVALLKETARIESETRHAV